MRFFISIAVSLCIISSGCDNALEQASSRKVEPVAVVIPQASSINMYNGTWISDFGYMPGMPNDRLMLIVGQDGAMSISAQRLVDGVIGTVATASGKAVEEDGNLRGELNQPPVELADFRTIVGDGSHEPSAIIVTGYTGYKATFRRQVDS